MKLEKNNRYFNIAAYTIIASLIMVAGIGILLNIQYVWQWIKDGIAFIYVLLEPLIIGLIVAYLLDPIVGFYEKRWHNIKGKKKFHFCKPAKEQKEERWPMRTVPTLLAFLTIICIAGLFILMIQMNVEQVAGNFSVTSLQESLAGYVAYFEKMMSGVTQFTSDMGIAKGQNIIERFYGMINQFVVSLYENLTNGLLSLGIHAINGLLAFVVAFYLLQDKARCLFVAKRFLRYCFNEKRYQYILGLGRKVDHIFSGYIRGEVIDSAIVVILTSGALMLVRLDFAIIIGIISGIFNLIPYFGPIVGFALTVIIGLLDPNPMKALYGAVAILIIQQIDGWFIVPKVVGDSVKLHPVIVLLAILIGGNLFGLIGMLLAVPFAAFIRLLLQRVMPELFKEE